MWQSLLIQAQFYRGSQSPKSHVNMWNDLKRCYSLYFTIPEACKINSCRRYYYRANRYWPPIRLSWLKDLKLVGQQQCCSTCVFYFFHKTRFVCISEIIAAAWLKHKAGQRVCSLFKANGSRNASNQSTHHPVVWAAKTHHGNVQKAFSVLLNGSGKRQQGSQTKRTVPAYTPCCPCAWKVT